MFGRRRKSEQRSGVECPLCHLMNNEDAQACSRCYYDFSKPSHQQVQPLENSESEGLLDLLVAEVDLNEEQEDLVDWTGHTFEMEDVTIDIHQYDDSGTVAISESPSFARQFVDTSSIGGKEDDLELEASDAPTDVERFVVPTEEIEDWNETLEHRVRLVDPTTGESAVDIDADLNESNWEASTGGTASAPNIEPQENLVTSTQTSLQDIQVASDSAAGNDAASLPPLPNGATAPIASPVQPAPAPVKQLIVEPAAATSPAPAALPSIPATPAIPVQAAPAPSPAMPPLPSQPVAAAAVPQSEILDPTSTPPAAAPPAAAFQAAPQTVAPLPPTQPHLPTMAPSTPAANDPSAASPALPPIPTAPTPRSAAPTAGIWPWPQSAPYEDRVIAQRVREAMERAKEGDAAGAGQILDEVGPHLGDRRRLLYPIGALMRNLGREEAISSMLATAAARYPDDADVRTAVEKLG